MDAYFVTRMDEILQVKLNGATGLDAAIRSTFAHLTEAPTNFHQMAVFFLSSKDPQDSGMQQQAPILFMGCVLMVLAQSAAATGLFLGIFGASCKDHGMCSGAGMFCDAMLERCSYCGDSCDHNLASYCGDAAIALSSGNSLNATDVFTACSSVVVPAGPGQDDGPDTGPGGGGNGGPGGGKGQIMGWKKALAAENWCKACVDATSSSNPVITLTQAATGEMNVDNMGAFDWITLLFASCIIALAIVGGKKRTQSP